MTLEAPVDTIGAMSLGIVYAYIRDDLGMVYVGQTTRPGQRARRHRIGEGSYVMAELAEDGIDPEYRVLESDVEADALDDAERSWMSTYIELGWTLINRLGPDDAWPHSPFESVQKVGLSAGPKRAASIHARRAEDPEYDAWWRGVAKLGNAALRARRATDSEFDAYCRERGVVGSLRAAEVRRTKRSTDPEWAVREREIARRAGRVGGRSGGLTTASKRFRCDVCGMVSTPGGIGVHQKSTMHGGKTDVTSITDPLKGK